MGQAPALLEKEDLDPVPVLLQTIIVLGLAAPGVWRALYEQLVCG